MLRKKKGAPAECGSLHCLAFLMRENDKLLVRLRSIADAAWVKFRQSAGDMKLYREWSALYDEWYAAYKHRYVLAARLHRRPT